MPQYTGANERAAKGEHWKLLNRPDHGSQHMRPFWPLTPPSLLREYDDTEAAKKALDQLGYRYEMESSEAHLLQLFHRAQRGLLSYEGVPVNELATFVAQRGLKVLTDRVSRSGKILRSALQTADEDLTFNRFSNLPRELQLSIMEFYFTSLSLLDLALPEHAQPPPVTHASRLTRSLSLPLFYKISRFTLILDLSSDRPNGRHRSTIFREPFWLQVINKEYARITKLRIIICRPGGVAEKGYHFDIDFSDKHKVTKLGGFTSQKWVPLLPAITRAQWDDMEHQLQAAVDGIASREGFKRIEKSDLRLLCSAIDRAVPAVKSKR